MPQTFVQRTAAQELGRQLGQSRPAGVTADSLYSPDDGVVTTVEKLVVVNTGASALFDVYHDEDGSTYNQSTALYYSRTIVANETLLVDLGLYMNNPNGNIGVRTSVTSALTFSLYGTEIKTRAR